MIDAVEGELPWRSNVGLRERLPVRDVATEAELMVAPHDASGRR